MVVSAKTYHEFDKTEKKELSKREKRKRVRIVVVIITKILVVVGGVAALNVAALV